MVPVPRLRPGVEIAGGLFCTVTDPRNSRCYALDATLYPILARLDGERDVEGLIAAVEAAGLPAPSPEAIAAALGTLERLDLLVPRDVAARPLSFHPGRRFSCLGCGVSCRRFRIGPILAEDRASIESVSWRARGYAAVPEDPFLELPVDGGDGRTAAYLRKKDDGSCVFLGADGLCDIHRALGASHKPWACQMFPYEAVEDADGVRILIQPGCSKLPQALEGELLAEQAPQIRALLSRMPSAPAASPSSPVFAHGTAADSALSARASIGFATWRALRERALDLLADPGRGGIIDRFGSAVSGILATAAAAQASERDLLEAFAAGADRGAPTAEADPALAAMLVRSTLAATREDLRGRAVTLGVADGLEQLETHRSREGSRVLAVLAALEERLTMPAEEKPATRTPPFSGPTEEYWRYYLGYGILSERGFGERGTLVGGYGALALRLLLCLTQATALAAEGGGALNPEVCCAAVNDIEAVVRIPRSRDLDGPLERFLATASYRLALPRP